MILLVQDPDTSLSDLEAYFTTPEGIDVLEHWFEEAPVYYGSHFGNLLVVKLRTESIPAGPYEVGVRVTDGDLSDTATLYVEVLNAPPQVDPEKKEITRTGISSGNIFMAWAEDPPCFTFTDANGDELSFRYEGPRYGYITSLTVSPEPSLGKLSSNPSLVLYNLLKAKIDVATEVAMRVRLRGRIFGLWFIVRPTLPPQAPLPRYFQGNAFPTVSARRRR